MNKYYVIKSTIESTKEVFYLKHPWGFILTENLVEAKLFSSYETARKTMDYAKNKQDLFIDEIVEVKVDNFGNVVEIEGGKVMDFGQALELMKQDDWNKVARKGWNGKGMYIHKCTPSSSPFSEDKSQYEHLPYLEMKTADNKFVPWLASQTDLLAEDWVEVK